MARTYKKNARNVYILPYYARISVWLIGLALVDGLLIWMNTYLGNATILIASYLLIALLVVLTSFWGYRLVTRFKKSRSFKSWCVELKAERSIRRSLLATMTVNRLQDTPFISVPNVTVCDRRPSHLQIYIEKLAGVYDVNMEKMTEDINSSLKGTLKNYAVTSGLITDDGLTYRFVAEDVGTDKTFRPVSLDDLITQPYHLKLQEGLIINLSERPHIAIYGRTGSKKTTLGFSLILQCFTMGADVRFIDGKDEFSSYAGFYPAEKIQSETDGIIDMLDDLLRVVKERQKLIARLSQERQKMGLRSADIGLRPVVLVADEIGSVVAQMDTKEAKAFISKLVAIIQRARSVGVHCLFMTQDPSTDVLPQKIRQQFTTRILLGSANSDIQRMALGEVATSGNVEDFRGFYVSDGLTIQPMKFFVPDLYSNNFNELDGFRKAYEFGQNNVRYP